MRPRPLALGLAFACAGHAGRAARPMGHVARSPPQGLSTWAPRPLGSSHPRWAGLCGCAFGRPGLRRASPRLVVPGSAAPAGDRERAPPLPRGLPPPPPPWAPALGLLLTPHFASNRSVAAGRDPRTRGTRGRRARGSSSHPRAGSRGLRQDVVSPFLQRGFSELVAQSARYDSRRGTRWFYLGLTLEDRTLRGRSHRTRPRAVRAQEILVAPFSATPRPSESLVFRVGSYTWRLEWGQGGCFLGHPSSHGPHACA